MQNIIISVLLIIAVCSACIYIYREKKKGNKCIGCSSSNSLGCPGCMACKKDSDDNTGL